MLHSTDGSGPRPQCSNKEWGKSCVSMRDNFELGPTRSTRVKSRFEKMFRATYPNKDWRGQWGNVDGLSSLTLAVCKFCTVLSWQVSGGTRILAAQVKKGALWDQATIEINCPASKRRETAVKDSSCTQVHRLEFRSTITGSFDAQPPSSLWLIAHRFTKTYIWIYAINDPCFWSILFIVDLDFFN